MTELTYEIEADILDGFHRNALYNALDKLYPLEQLVLRGYFGIGTAEKTTLQAVADRLGWSHAFIWQCKNRALVRLAEFMQDWENDTPTTPEERRRIMTVVHQKDKQTGYYRFERVWS